LNSFIGGSIGYKAVEAGRVGGGKTGFAKL